MGEGGVHYSVVVPIFNEAAVLRELHRRIVATLEPLGKPFELVLVDDGSTDESFEILEALHRDDERVRVIRFTRNFGQHPAVYAGFHNARGEIIITLDADLQNPPEEIPKVLALIQAGYDVGAGVRQNRHDSLLRRIPSRFVNAMIGRLTGVKLRDYGCLLRAYRREIIEQLLSCREQTVYFTALIAWLGARIGEVEVDHAPRAVGKSRYHFLKLLTLNFDLLTGYSILPIQVVSLVGIGLAGLGFLASLVILGFSLALGEAYNWPLLFGVLFFALGLLLMSLGMIGEYVGRILIEVKQRPYYLVRTKLEKRP